MGDIGPVRREIEFEPFPTGVPAEEPSEPSVPAPAEPKKVPVPA